ncbi:MAG TPA: SprT family zinc-dependent metalloprotease [Candidatus Nitrosocosmicus sp.]|nr:SprT family zinc-dependent metalloprotease [Candidatus Nitrosocosmicus sp.]
MSAHSSFNIKHQIIYENNVLEFQIIRTQRRRKTNEILIEYGNVSVRTSTTSSLKEIELLVSKKAKWIFKKIKEQDNPEASIKVPIYQDDSTLPFLGKNYRLRIIGHSSNLLCFTNNGFVIYSNRKNVKRIYEQWLADIAHPIISPIIVKYSKLLNVSPKKILLKKLKSRWGSATYHNIINVNIHLLKAPLDVIEYVILHELSHLIERNHSKQFWKIVSDYMSDYKIKIRWLKVNGPYII